MIHELIANVYWKGIKATALPEGLRYITVAKFPEDINWMEEAWSIVLDFDVSPKQQGNPSKAKVRFLVKDAPHNRLIKGKKFELYEGRSLVAEVEVI